MVQDAQSVKIKDENALSSAYSDDDSDPPLLSRNLHFATTPGKERPPLSFIKPPNYSQRVGLYPNPKKHPHFHPLVHGEGAQNEMQETQLNDGEVEDEDEDKNENEEESERNCVLKVVKE